MDFLKKAIKHYPIICLAVVFVVIFGIVAGIKYAGNDQRSPEMTLEKYYDAFYETRDLEALKECVTAELRETVETTFGTAYIGDGNMLTMYAQSVMDVVGYENFEANVEVTSNERSTAQVLGNVRETYPDATAYHVLQFTVTWTGDIGSHTQRGETCLMKRDDGRWYLVESQLFLYDME